MTVDQAVAEAFVDVSFVSLAPERAAERVDGRVHTNAFSPRERDVLRLLVEGNSNAEIADALYIGVRTARAHVTNILAKLEVSSRTAAATYAVRHGIV